MKHRHLRADPESLHQGPLVPKLYRRRRHRTGGSEKPKLLAVPNAQLAFGGRMTILPLRGCFGSPCPQKHAADRRWINLLSSVMAENDNQSTDPIRSDSRPLCDQHPKLKQRGGQARVGTEFNLQPESGTATGILFLAHHRDPPVAVPLSGWRLNSVPTRACP